MAENSGGGGWLSGLTDWFKQAFKDVWDSVSDALHDAGVWVFEQMTDLAAVVINAIPVPDFIENLDFSQLFANIDSPLLWWAAGMFHLPLCFTILGAGVAFNLLRKLLTLGQW